MEKFYEIMEPLPVGKANEMFCRCSYCSKPLKLAITLHWQTEELFYGLSSTCGDQACEEHASKDFDYGKAIAKGEI